MTEGIPNLEWQFNIGRSFLNPSLPVVKSQFAISLISCLLGLCPLSSKTRTFVLTCFAGNRLGLMLGCWSTSSSNLEFFFCLLFKNPVPQQFDLLIVLVQPDWLPSNTDSDFFGK